MKVLSLFSGIGGFDLGLERAGMEIIGHAEIDPFCSKVLSKHWPGVPNYGDVRSIASTNEEWTGRGVQWEGRRHLVGSGIDLICGGFPCQDLSVAGKRAGLDGARSGLWFEFQRILLELRPSWVIIENVPGLLSSNQGRDFAVILDGLGECGFAGISWAVLDSQHFGVAQRRRRVYVVGGPSRRSVEQVLSLCESCGGHPAKGRETGQDTSDSTGYGVANTLLDKTGRLQVEETFIPTLAGTLNAHDGDKWGANQWVNEDKMFAVRTAQTSSNGWGVNEEGTAYTLDGADGQAVSTGAAVRRLTPTECERLQGFPDGWTQLDDRTPDGSRYKALGNAVSVPVIEYLGLRIMAVSQ